MKEEELYSLWFRLGVSVALTKDEVEQMKKDSDKADGIIMSSMKRNGFEISGDSYIPSDPFLDNDEKIFGADEVDLCFKPEQCEVVQPRKIYTVTEIEQGDGYDFYPRTKSFRTREEAEDFMHDKDMDFRQEHYHRGTVFLYETHEYGMNDYWWGCVDNIQNRAEYHYMLRLDETTL